MPKTGATSYQKFLKSEKTKTKLKVKKELLKGTNVTKTNFKIKKIIIKEQLKTHGENEILTTKKLNIKELLSRLKHFNATSRTESLNGLKEMINRRDIFSENVNQFVYGVTPLVLDVDKTVRHESFKLLHLALTSPSADRMQPFFEVMFSYLRCAMTHIDTRIQEDSLFFLDMLLSCMPTQIAINFQIILPNFMDMVSKLRTDSKPGRTLTVNLGSKMTSVKWRVKVLTRLHEFLRIIVNYKKDAFSDSYQRESKNNLHFYAPNKPNYFSLFNPVFKSNCSLSCLFRNNKIDSTLINTDETERFKSYVEILIPLLFETWVEVGPSEMTAQTKKLETVISEEAASLLKQILSVISLLWQYLQMLQKNNPSTELVSWFKEKFKREYSKHFISHFPYATIIRSSVRGNENLDQSSSKLLANLVHENLEMCYLYTSFNSNINLKQQGLEINKILNYTESLFTHNVEDNNNEKVIKVLSCLFSKECQGWTRNVTMLEPLFNKLILCYLEKELPSCLHQQVFSLLCTVLLDDRLAHFHKIPIFQLWIRDLPDILCGENVTIQTVMALHKIAVQSNSLFNQTFKRKMAQILPNLPNINLVNNDNVEYKQKLWSLLYWINGWDSENLNILENQLANNVYGVAGGKYIVEILKIKSEVDK